MFSSGFGDVVDGVAEGVIFGIFGVLVESVGSVIECRFVTARAGVGEVSDAGDDSGRRVAFDGVDETGAVSVAVVNDVSVEGGEWIT